MPTLSCLSSSRYISRFLRGLCVQVAEYLPGNTRLMLGLLLWSGSSSDMQEKSKAGASNLPKVPSTVDAVRVIVMWMMFSIFVSLWLKLVAHLLQVFGAAQAVIKNAVLRK